MLNQYLIHKEEIPNPYANFPLNEYIQGQNLHIKAKKFIVDWAVYYEIKMKSSLSYSLNEVVTLKAKILKLLLKTIEL